MESPVVSHRLVRQKLVLSALLTAAIAARGRAQGGYPPLPYTTRDVEQADANRRSVYVTNNTKDTMTVIGVNFTRCENIRPFCGETPVNKIILPGKTEAVIYIDRLDKKLGWSWSYQIKTKPIRMAAPQGAPTRMVVGSDGGRGVAVPIKVEEFRPLVDTSTTNSSCGQMTGPGLPEGHQSLVMIFGSESKPTARTVIIYFNGSGIPYQYSDMREALTTDTLKTFISLDLVRESGIVRNTHGQTADWFSFSGRIGDAASLGRPSEMAARVLKECGKK